ncbi:MAG: potassium/proton antiporter [Candidatus Omnitrophota bacterium]
MPSVENLLFAAGLLLLLSTIISKISDRFGIPALLLFLIIGMLAGSEGIGGIYFNNALVAESLGIVALMFILFAGGFDTPLKDIRHILARGIVLSTIGVMLTAFVVAVAAVFLLKFSWAEGLLLGAIVSSTDAAAVFSVLRSNRVSLRGKLKPLIELESGSNDPMAVFLTLSIIHLIKHPSTSTMDLLPSFILDIGGGLFIGWLFGRGIIIIINRVKLAYEGLYPALLFSLIFLTYTTAHEIQGNGFLAVYLAGIISGNANLIHKKTLKNFLEGFAWLMQIVMFLTLGLLVFPSHIVPVLGVGLLISLVLMFVARPLSVWMCLLFSKFNWREKTMVAWVGLRGAVPIILATFPLLAGLPKADMMFNIVFFIVLTSILFQGTSVPFIARQLKVDAPLKNKSDHPIELTDNQIIHAQLEDLIVPLNSPIAGHSIVELGLPSQSLIVLICRDEKFFIPNGATTLNTGDILWVLASKVDLKKMHKILGHNNPS